MLILAIDSSAKSASVAVSEDGALLGEYFINTKQTHSQTLLPMVEQLLSALGKRCSDFDLFAVSNGPGSFTGVRIGVACVKGLALTNNTNCCGVSTLEVIAATGRALNGKIICAVMDARCGQVYNALFKVVDGSLERLTEDRAISIDDLSAECENYGSELILFGDGAELCYDTFREWGAQIAPEEIRFQRASSVAYVAEKQAKTLLDNGASLSPSELQPAYLRLPQAERELKKKKENEGK